MDVGLICAYYCLPAAAFVSRARLPKAHRQVVSIRLYSSSRELRLAGLPGKVFNA
jgi:hypothetical protein